MSRSEKEGSANGGELGLVESAPDESVDCAESEEKTVSESSVVKQSRARLLLGAHTTHAASSPMHTHITTILHTVSSSVQTLDRTTDNPLN